MLTKDVLQTIRAQNSGRDYPLDPVKSVVPFPVLVDAEISVPYSIVSEDGKSNYTLFVKQLAVTTSDITVIIAAYNNINKSSVEVASAYCTYEQLNEASSDIAAAGIPLSPIDNSEGISGVSGFIYLGDPDVIMANGGLWDTLTPETAKFNLQCIHPYQSGFSGLVIDGQKLTGDITLNAGEGIRIEVEEDNIINISTEYDSEYLIRNREKLIEEITAKYGTPITSINNIPPNSNGNFSFRAPEDSCVIVDSCDYGITIYNPCATTCCDDSYLNNVVENLNTLNAKSARLTEYLTAVSTNLNSLINELAMLKLGAGQQ